MDNTKTTHYQYANANEGYAHGYLLPALLKSLVGCEGPIVDLGCGNGWLTRNLLQRGFDIYGVDASASGIAVAGKVEPGRFFELDVQSGRLPLELSALSFRTVISTEVIEHLYDPRGFLDFARRILTQQSLTDGKLIITTPYHGYLKNVALAVSGKLDAHFTATWDGGHIKFFSRATLEALLRERGFAPESFGGAGRMPYLWRSMVVKARVD